MHLLQEPEIIVFIMGTFIALFSTIIGCVIWFIRLEGRVNYHEKMLEQESEARKLLDAAVKEKLEVVHKRIDGGAAKHEALEEKILDKLTELEKAFARACGAWEKQGFALGAGDAQ